MVSHPAINNPLLTLFAIGVSHIATDAKVSRGIVSQSHTLDKVCFSMPITYNLHMTVDAPPISACTYATILHVYRCAIGYTTHPLNMHI